MGKKEYERQGHYRSSINGTVHWVRSHSVISEDFALSQVGSAFFVNGSKVTERHCQYCYKGVFLYQNEHGSRVFFDSLGEPWQKHVCYHGKNKPGVKMRVQGSEPRKKPFVDPIALERRREEIDEKIATRERKRAEKKLKNRPKQNQVSSRSKGKSARSKKNAAPSEQELAMNEAENKARRHWRRWRKNADPEVVIKKVRNIGKLE